MPSSLVTRATVVVHTISMAIGMEDTISTTVKEMKSCAQFPNTMRQMNAMPQRVNIGTTIDAFRNRKVKRIPLSGEL
jgi:hypothetical protein